MCCCARNEKAYVPLCIALTISTCCTLIGSELTSPRSPRQPLMMKRDANRRRSLADEKAMAAAARSDDDSLPFASLLSPAARAKKRSGDGRRRDGRPQQQHIFLLLFGQPSHQKATTPPREL